LEKKHGRKYELDYLVNAAAESFTDIEKVEKMPLKKLILHLQLRKFSRWVSEGSAKSLSKQK
jgi:hypothetical protein